MNYLLKVVGNEECYFFQWFVKSDEIDKIDQYFSKELLLSLVRFDIKNNRFKIYPSIFC